MSSPFESWGRYPKVDQNAIACYWPQDLLPQSDNKTSLLPYGQGRSYGDSCLNDGNSIVLTRGLDRFLAFDRERGLLRCEAGVTLAEVLEVTVPQGWFIPVSPGTKFVSVGGAIANDIHGKNHHCAGSFGCHVTRFELLRSDGTRKICSPRENPDWFFASIGGLGLTGLITWAEFQLKKIHNAWIAQESTRFDNLEGFFALSREFEKGFEYTVSWIDCLARGKNLGRGIFIRGNHAPAGTPKGPPHPANKRTVPFDAPAFALNPLSVKLFNFFYYRKHWARTRKATVPYDPFFYPLDAIHHWNRIYGKRGFLQYQCVVPFKDGGAAIGEILSRIADSKLGSFLVVLKVFGSIPSVGLLSFPREGVTLTLDFPNTGKKLFILLAALDRIVMQAGGALYPAKDARMSREIFQQGFPRYEEFKKFIDPGFSSSFWRRVE